MNHHTLAGSTKDLAFSDQELIPIQTPKIGTTIGEIHSTLRSALELSSNLRAAVYIVSGKQIDTNCDFSELSKDNIPDDLLAIKRNVQLLTDSLQKTLETLENSL